MSIRPLGFLYTTRLGTVLTFGRSGDIRSQSLVWSTRAPWRAAVSLAWNRWLALRLAGTSLIRIGIHPSDLSHPRVWEQVRRLAGETSRCRACVSYEKFVDQVLTLS
jgi:hypothetical protein